MKISFWHISVHGGHIGKTNYIITKLDNFNFSYLMNRTTDFNSWGLKMFLYGRSMRWKYFKKFYSNFKNHLASLPCVFVSVICFFCFSIMCFCFSTMCFCFTSMFFVSVSCVFAWLPCIFVSVCCDFNTDKVLDMNVSTWSLLLSQISALLCFQYR